MLKVQDNLVCYLCHMRNCVYILTNRDKSVLYTGVTDNLARRLVEHRNYNPVAFTTRYAVHHLVYFEEYDRIVDAIYREKEIKNMSRAKKNALISDFNPTWRFLDEEEE
jgi:putative endonuclease